MLSEDFDRMIKEAADHHHPAYDEKAWSGMKKLLDRHMPEGKDDKRRYFFFLLLFLLLGGGAAWYFTGRGSGDIKNERAVTVKAAGNGTANKQQPVNTVSADATPPAANEVKSAEQKMEDGTVVKNNKETRADNTDEKDISVQTEPAPRDRLQTNLATRKKSLAGKQKDNRKEKISSAVAKNTAPVATDTRTVKADPPVTTTAPAEPVARKADPAIVSDAAIVIAGDSKKDPVQPPVSKNIEGEKAGNDEQKTQPVTTVKKEENNPDRKTDVAKKTKKTSAKKSAFFFSVSGGPDISYTGNDKPGRMQFVGGAGIGYTYKEKFTLRSGFYSARKVYTSSPGEYHPPSEFYTYYPNLQKVDADCKVYEIPLSLSYHFGQQKKHNWFASTGISTLLMKRETYDYYYKYYPGGPTQQRKHTTYNENRHFFSVMTLSAGYQRSAGKRVSITAEPYFKLPLSGVGYGKVKLNSAGVLFSISVKPFQQPDKK